MARTTAKRTARSASPAPRWLDADEEAGWRALAEVMVRLQWALESQLQRDAGLSFIEYHALARLSEEPTRTLRMSELAVVTNASLSRLSHLVKRLESRGLIRRESDPANGRYTNAILTEAGHAKLLASAPAHVETVRALLIDPLSASELAGLRNTAERLLPRLRER